MFSELRRITQPYTQAQIIAVSNGSANLRRRLRRLRLLRRLRQLRRQRGANVADTRELGPLPTLFDLSLLCINEFTWAFLTLGPGS